MAYPGTGTRPFRLQTAQKLRGVLAYQYPCDICKEVTNFPDWTGAYVVCCPGYISGSNITACWEMAEYLLIWSKVRDLPPVSIEYYLEHSLLD